ARAARRRGRAWARARRRSSPRARVGRNRAARGASCPGSGAPHVARGGRIGLVSPAAGGAASMALVRSGAAREPRRPPVSSQPAAASARRARAHRERLVGRRGHRPGLLRRARPRRRAAVGLQGPRGPRLVFARKVRLMGYAELHAISNFTFLRGASHPEELVERAAELGYAALALTDECSVAGIVRALVAAEERGLKLIVGSELTVDDAPPDDRDGGVGADRRDGAMKIVVLAPSRDGYGALSTLITCARRAAAKGGYRLCRDDLV